MFGLENPPSFSRSAVNMGARELSLSVSYFPCDGIRVFHGIWPKLSFGPFRAHARAFGRARHGIWVQSTAFGVGQAIWTLSPRHFVISTENAEQKHENSVSRFCLKTERFVHRNVLVCSRSLQCTQQTALQCSKVARAKRALQLFLRLYQYRKSPETAPQVTVLRGLFSLFRPKQVGQRRRKRFW